MNNTITIRHRDTFSPRGVIDTIILTAEDITIIKAHCDGYYSPRQWLAALLETIPDKPKPVSMQGMPCVDTLECNLRDISRRFICHNMFGEFERIDLSKSSSVNYHFSYEKDDGDDGCQYVCIDFDTKDETIIHPYYLAQAHNHLE